MVRAARALRRAPRGVGGAVRRARALGAVPLRRAGEAADGRGADCLRLSSRRSSSRWEPVAGSRVASGRRVTGRAGGSSTSSVSVTPEAADPEVAAPAFAEPATGLSGAEASSSLLSNTHKRLQEDKCLLYTQEYMWWYRVVFFHTRLRNRCDER